jgi:hypothetical protein
MNDEQMNGSYQVLETLQALHVFLSYMKGSLRGMLPAAQALWDKELTECVQRATNDVARMDEWALQQMQIKAPANVDCAGAGGGWEDVITVTRTEEWLTISAVGHMN